MKTLNQLEREYFIRKLNTADSQTKSVDQIKREYFIAQTGAANSNISITELEKRWLLKVLGDAGVTPASIYTADLWRMMVATLNVAPSRFTKENKLKWFLNAS